MDKGWKKSKTIGFEYDFALSFFCFHFSTLFNTFITLQTTNLTLLIIINFAWNFFFFRDLSVLFLQSKLNFDVRKQVRGQRITQLIVFFVLLKTRLWHISRLQVTDNNDWRCNQISKLCNEILNHFSVSQANSCSYRADCHCWHFFHSTLVRFLKLLFKIQWWKSTNRKKSDSLKRDTIGSVRTVIQSLTTALFSEFCGLKENWLLTMWKLNFSPAHPDEMVDGTIKNHESWAQLYPNIGEKKVEFADSE